MNEVCDAMREHTSLARAGTGDDKQRTTTVNYGVELIGVERPQIERIKRQSSLRW